MEKVRDFPYRIAVVGGGVEGWLAALMLERRLRDAGRPFEISVLESDASRAPDGAEATTAVFRRVLNALGLGETEFVRETGATLRLGTRRVDWRELGHRYDDWIDDPHRVAADVLPLDKRWPWLDVSAIAAGQPISEHRLFHHLAELDKCAFALDGDAMVSLGTCDHAFHVEPNSVAAWLRSRAGHVTAIDATVDAVRLTERGDIECLVTGDGREIHADFFIDCTGTARHLVGEVLQTPWIPCAHVLPANRALPFRLEHAIRDRIPPCTESRARRAGWTWALPTHHGIDCSYVYCDAFVTADEAQAEIESALGHRIDPSHGLAIEPGRLDAAWRGNCVAIGLAQSQLEPLGPTSMHATIVQLMLLTTRHLEIEGGIRFIGASDYNRVVGRQVDDFRDFLNLHYASGRDDTPFWRQARTVVLTEDNRDRIDRWARTMPRSDDFATLPDDLPHVQEHWYYPVLDGLGLLDPKVAKRLLSEHLDARGKARKLVASLSAEHRRTAATALDHGRWLAELARSRAAA